MSAQDKEIVDITGFKVAEVARLLRRSRAAIYLGLANEKPYFQVPQLVTIARATLERNPMNSRKLNGYIESAFPKDADLILPHRVALSQLESAAKGAKKVVVGYNDNAEHLQDGSTFKEAIQRLLKNKVPVMVYTKSDWANKYFSSQIPGVRAVQAPRKLDIHVLYFIIVKDKDPRMFVLGSNGPFEVEDKVAQNVLINLGVPLRES